MGLDMYLEKTKRVNGLTAKDYTAIDEYLSTDERLEDAPVDMEKIDLLRGSLKEVGKYYHWKSIFTQVGYWRKANAIHRWFVDNVQGGEDNCATYIVEKDKLEDLLQIVKKVQECHNLAQKLLPSQPGFFFGSTEYDEWYYNSLEETQKILEKVLGETDFEEEVVFYASSW